MLNITKEVYQSRSNRLPKDIQRRRPQESAFRMSKGLKTVEVYLFCFAKNGLLSVNHKDGGSLSVLLGQKLFTFRQP